jgi:hypothetical protein
MIRVAATSSAFDGFIPISLPQLSTMQERS